MLAAIIIKNKKEDTALSPRISVSSREKDSLTDLFKSNKYYTKTSTNCQVCKG